MFKGLSSPPKRRKAKREEEELRRQRKRILIGCCCCSCCWLLLGAITLLVLASQGIGPATPILGGGSRSPALGGGASSGVGVQELVPSPPPAPPSPPSPPPSPPSAPPPPSPPWFSVNGDLQYAYSYIKATSNKAGTKIGGTNNSLVVKIFDFDGNEMMKLPLYETGVSPDTDEAVNRRDLLTSVDWASVGDFQFEMTGDDQSRIQKIFVVLVFQHAMIRVMPTQGTFPTGGKDSIIFDAGTASGGIAVPTDKLHWEGAFCNVEVTGGADTADAQLYAQIRGYEPGTPKESQGDGSEFAAISEKVLVADALGNGGFQTTDILPKIWRFTDTVDFLYDDDAIIFTVEPKPGATLPSPEVTFAHIKVSFRIFSEHLEGDHFPFAVPSGPGEYHSFLLEHLEVPVDESPRKLSENLWQ